MRYLGAGGLYVGWRGEAVLTGPFFSNPGVLRVGLGTMRIDEAAIRDGLAALPLARVGAILAGHSHYDHVGDLPVVAGLAPRAALAVNRSGVKALAAYPELAGRVRELEGIAGLATQLVDAEGRALPFRLLALPSHHAPHVFRFKLWTGETESSARPWTERRYGALKEGQTFAFVLDLLGPEEEGSPVRFRIYVQDAAAAEPLGWPPVPGGDDPPFDLAVVCVASAHWVEPYPQGLLARTKPGHVLAIHAENFFRPWGPKRGFVPLLSRGQVERFLRRADETLAVAGVAGSPPVGEVCGPSSARWTMPLTGEWLVFRPSYQGDASRMR